MSAKEAAKVEEIEEQPVAEQGDQTAEDGKVKLELVDADSSPGTSAGSVQAARFGQLTETSVTPDMGSIDLLMDVDLDLSVELGRSSMPVRDILQLGSGSIVELNKLAGDAVDVLVNGRLIARGEVVVVDENFGVRVTEIVSPNERLNRLT